MRAEIERFLYLEARLLDERRFEEWMNLFAEERLVLGAGRTRPERPL